MHIWIIMDWNRRWAKSRGLPSFMWHRAWAKNVTEIIKHSIKKNITHLTLWALSVDNLNKRDENEVQEIIKLINDIENYLSDSNELWLRFETIWDITKLPDKSVEILKRVKDNTKNNSKIVLTLALIYWWQDDIVRATKKIIASGIDPETLSREEFRKYLDTGFLPNPDLIIRTWWDIRHSWFLLYDSEYSEYYFTDKKWPEFDEKELDKALDFLSNSKRNFWK